MPKKGYKQSPEHRAKRAEALRGRKLSEEHAAKIGQAIKATWVEADSRHTRRITKAEREERARLRRMIEEQYKSDEEQMIEWLVSNPTFGDWRRGAAALRKAGYDPAERRAVLQAARELL